MYRDSDEVMI